jgi:hypothetical protein
VNKKAAKKFIRLRPAQQASLLRAGRLTSEERPSFL